MLNCYIPCSTWVILNLLDVSKVQLDENISVGLIAKKSKKYQEAFAQVGLKLSQTPEKLLLSSKLGYVDSGLWGLLLTLYFTCAAGKNISNPVSFSLFAVGVVYMFFHIM